MPSKKKKKEEEEESGYPRAAGNQRVADLCS